MKELNKIQNLFRNNISRQQRTKITKLIGKQQAKIETTKQGLFALLIKKGIVSDYSAIRLLPYFSFVALLTIIYISNRHILENKIRDIDKANKELRELHWEYLTLKSDLMFKSKQTEVAHKVRELGLRESVKPPIKIEIQEYERED